MVSRTQSLQAHEGRRQGRPSTITAKPLGFRNPIQRLGQKAPLLDLVKGTQRR